MDTTTPNIVGPTMLGVVAYWTLPSIKRAYGSKTTNKRRPRIIEDDKKKLGTLLGNLPHPDIYDSISAK